MYEELYDDVLCYIACGNFYFTQIGDFIGEANVEKVLEELENENLIYFAEVRVHLTEKGLKRIQGKLTSFLANQE